MPEKKSKGRDFPLAPTSAPQAIDNTSVQKRNYAAEAAAPHYKRAGQSLNLSKDLYKEATYNTDPKASGPRGNVKEDRIKQANSFRLEALKEKKTADSLKKQK